MTAHKSGQLLYIICLCLTCFSVLFQELPINSVEHFSSILNIDSIIILDIHSLFFILYALMQIPGGYVLDIFGIKKILPISILITLIGCTLYMYSDTLYMLAFSRIILGLGISIAYISTLYIISTYYTPKTTLLLIGVTEVAATSGAIFSTVSIHILLMRYGWQAINLGIIGLLIVLLISTLFLIRPLKPQPRTHTITIKSIIQRLSIIFHNQTLILLFLYSFFTWGIIMPLAGYWIKDYMVAMHHYSIFIALTLARFYWMSFLFGSLACGLLIKKQKHIEIVIVLVALLNVIDFIYMMIPRLFNYDELLFVILAGGIAASGVVLSFTLVIHNSPQQTVATAIACNNLFIIMGGWCGIIIFGKLIQIHYGVFPMLLINHINASYYIPLLTYVIFAILAFLCIVKVIVNIRTVQSQPSQIMNK